MRYIGKGESSLCHAVSCHVIIIVLCCICIREIDLESAHYGELHFAFCFYRNNKFPMSGLSSKRLRGSLPRLQILRGRGGEESKSIK